MKNLIKRTCFAIYILLTCVILISCDSDKNRREKLGKNPVIMTDTNGNKWLVKHTFGDNYRIEYLPDSVDFNAR